MRALLNKIVTTNEEFESSFHRGSGVAQGNSSRKLTLKFFGQLSVVSMSVSYFAVDENLTASSMAYYMVWIVLLRFDNFMLYARNSIYYYFC